VAGKGPRPYHLDRLAHLIALVAAQIVHDDDVARRERRHEDLRHVVQKGFGGDGAIEQHRGAVRPVGRKPATKVVLFH
jgi:hypothetical protein